MELHQSKASRGAFRRAASASAKVFERHWLIESCVSSISRTPEPLLTSPASMTIRLFNTLSSSVEEIAPAEGNTLRMYACGPTVYDYGHIGNFRTFLQVDVLRRFLKQQACSCATS